eukprot:4429988-Pyramimonas_sp.AAC.1
MFPSERGVWEASKKGLERAHPIGCTSVSWAPAAEPGALVSPHVSQAPVKRLCSAGCDNTVKVWSFNEATKEWKVDQVLEGHTDWVRDAAWAPNIGLPMNTIASCGQDGLVFAWTQAEAGSPWKSRLIQDFKVPVWRVSWSVTGSLLAVSDGNNVVTLWKEQLDETWVQVSTVQG